MARMHPITLAFENENLERELRSETLDAALAVVILFGVLNLVLNLLAGHGTPLVQACLATIYTLSALAMRSAYKYRTGYEAHNMAAHLWTSSWALGISVWWTLIKSGSLQRLSADDGQKAAACCGLWVLSTVVQHMVHIGFAHRAVLLALALSIILSSEAWRGELLASLVVGDASGYAIEHMLRASFLRRHVRIEQLREEKDRVLYDYALAEARHRRAEDQRTSETRRRRTASSCSGSSGSRGGSDAGYSSGTNSEIAGYNKRSHSPPHSTQALAADDADADACAFSVDCELRLEQTLHGLFNSPASETPDGATRGAGATDAPR